MYQTPLRQNYVKLKYFAMNSKYKRFRNLERSYMFCFSHFCLLYLLNYFENVSNSLSVILTELEKNFFTSDVDDDLNADFIFMGFCTQDPRIIC